MIYNNNFEVDSNGLFFKTRYIWVHLEIIITVIDTINYSYRFGLLPLFGNNCKIKLINKTINVESLNKVYNKTICKFEILMPTNTSINAIEDVIIWKDKIKVKQTCDNTIKKETNYNINIK